MDGQFRLLCLRFGIGSAEVAGAWHAALPARADEEPAFLEGLAAFLIANRIPNGTRVTLGVPRAESVLRRFETPRVRLRSLPELVAFETERHLPGRREDFLCGWRVEGRTAGGGYRLLLGATRKTVVDRPAALLRRANLAPASVQLEAFVLAECLRRAARDKADVLLIELGQAAAGLDFVRGGRPEFSRVFPVDDQQWRESPADLADAGSVAARQMAAQRLGAALAARLGSALFRESLPGGKLPEVRLCGYGANRSQLIEKLQNELRVPVRAFSPWPLVRWDKPPADLTPYTAALALALAKSGAAALGPELAPERQQELHKAPSLRLSAVLALLLLAVLLTHLGAFGLRQQRQLALADEETRRLKGRMSQVEAVNRNVLDQRARRDLLARTVRGRVLQTEVLRELTGLIPDGAYLNELTYRDRTVEITGVAPSASKLLPVLEASPLFSGVEFSAPIVAQGAGLERFRIRMRLGQNGG